MKEPLKTETLTLNIKDFAEAFGTSEDEVSLFCGNLIRTLDFKYTICPQETREKIFLDVITKCDHALFPVSGKHRKPDWRKGWGENLKDLFSSEDLGALIPKYWRGDRPLRYKGEYILASSDSFERDFGDVFKLWLYHKYFKDYDNIYDFGCGTGYDLANMAGKLPGKRFFGMDWAPESQGLLATIAEKYGWQMKGINFDLFRPDYKLEILPNSLVYTSSSLEQLGVDHNSFTNYLLAKQPSLCVNMECLSEYYDKNNLFDFLALKYHKARNYLDGFLTRLRGFEKEEKIKIIATKRTGFGSLYHEAYMYVIWKIL
ncbi:MAG: class I SAM-dependent methyltransferase [Dehalococcoidia bacterium]|nr:MAG: class I SAM-dependent methyltransferase [Dehalococcoidia bacterium]